MQEKIMKILKSNSKISNFTLDSNLVTDFGLSSLDLAEIVCDIEDELGIEIAEKDLMRLKTVGDVLSYAKAV